MSECPADSWSPPLVEVSVDEGAQPSTVVLEATAAATNTPIEELPPLQNSVDTDALDDIFDDRSTSGYVAVRYVGHVVRVHADDVVTVHETT